MIDLERDLRSYGEFLSDAVPRVEPHEVRALIDRTAGGRRWSPALIAAVAAVAMLLLIGGAVALLRPSATERPAVTEPPPSERTTLPPSTTVPEREPTTLPPTTAPDELPSGMAAGYYSFDGRSPSQFPDRPLSIGFFSAGGNPALLVAAFGSPQEGDAVDDATWRFPGGAWFHWGSLEIGGLEAGVPLESPVRFALFAEVILGESTLGDVVEAWGEPLTRDADGITYTYGGMSVRFSAVSPSTAPASERRVETVRMVELPYWSRFIDNGMAGIEVYQDCDDRGCLIRSDDEYWEPSGGLTPFYSWGVSCLGEPCEYVGLFMGSAPPATTTPAATGWKVQSSAGVGGFVLARVLDSGHLDIVASDVAAVGSDAEVVGPFPSLADPTRFRFSIITPDGPVETYVMSLSRLTVSPGLLPVSMLGWDRLCGDLHAMGYDYIDAVSYWISDGQTSRMDADGNGIPCQTVYGDDEIAAFWGEPLPVLAPLPPDLDHQVVEPQYQVASRPGSGGLYGSGCTPGDDLGDGIWFGEVTVRAATTLEFDLMCFGPGPDGPGTVDNTTPATRTLQTAPEARVWRMGSDGMHWVLSAYRAWLVLPPSPFCGEGCPVWLYVNDGLVTEIVELWFA